jgi:hypothetical protein
MEIHPKLKEIYRRKSLIILKVKKIGLLSKNGSTGITMHGRFLSNLKEASKARHGLRTIACTLGKKKNSM